MTDNSKGPNEHIYTDPALPPVISLVCETLSDGSYVYNLVLRERELGCLDEKRGRELMNIISSAMHATLIEDVKHF